jgi:hypothetical protein
MTPEERARDLASTLRNTNLATREDHERMILRAIEGARKDERESILKIIDEKLEIASGLSDMEPVNGPHPWGHKRRTLEELRELIEPRKCPSCNVRLDTVRLLRVQCPNCKSSHEKLLS